LVIWLRLLDGEVYSGFQLKSAKRADTNLILYEYVFSGAIGLICAVIFLLMISESPKEHPSISKSELLYIEASIKSPVSSKEPIPWKLLLTSREIWILALPAFADNWGFYAIVTLLPKYFNG